MRKRKTSTPKPVDQLVPIRGDRVREVLGMFGLSETELADAVGDSQQTINLICQGITKRTRQSRVKRMAKTLDVPWIWLTGQMATLPELETADYRVIVASAKVPLALKRWLATFMTAVEQDTKTEPEDVGTLPGLELSSCQTLGTSTKLQLALKRWFDAYIPAIERDAKKEPEDLDSIALKKVVISLLIYPQVWQSMFFAPPESGVLANDSDETDVRISKMVDALLIIFEPWIRGDVKLNYKAVLRMAREHVKR